METKNINIKKESFNQSFFGKIMNSLETTIIGSLIGFFLILFIVCISLIDFENNKIIFHKEFFTRLEFSEKSIFIGIIFGIFFIIMFFINLIPSFSGSNKSRILWRLFPIIKSGKKKVIEKMNKKIITLKEKSQNRPQEIQNEIQECKEYIIELKNELKGPCPYQKEILELEKKIEQLN